MKTQFVNTVILTAAVCLIAGIVYSEDTNTSGQEPPATSSSPMFVHVCTDTGAGGYEAFPDVCRLQDGSLMCVFYAGYGHVSLPNDQLPKGGRVSYCLSWDEGRTWSEAKTLYDGPDDDRDPSIVVTEFWELRFFHRGHKFAVVPIRVKADGARQKP